MSRRSIRILACSAALLSLLTLATPAQAAGWTSWAPNGGILQAAWDLITGIWTPGQPAQGHPHAKKGLGVDPNGGATTTDTDRDSGMDPNGTKSDRGAGIDPDGLLSTAPDCQTDCHG